MNASQIQSAIESAESIEQFADIDMAIRALPASEQAQLRGALNAATAPQMFVLKAEIDGQGLTTRFMRQASILREAGYPTGGPAFNAWKHRMLTQGSHDSEATLTEIFMDEKLSDEERDALVRLEAAASKRGGTFPFEAGWADVVHTPTGRLARDRAAAKRAAQEAYEGSEGYTFLLGMIEAADRDKALRIIAGEVSTAAENEQERTYLHFAIAHRRAWLAGEAVRTITEKHGWDTVQAIYERGDITRDLTDGASVREFMALMDSIGSSIAVIREVDAKLGARVVRETYARAGERVRERKSAADMKARLAEKLAKLDEE
jgi:hypothetical protein